MTIDLNEREQALLSEALIRYIQAVSDASATLVMSDAAYDKARKFKAELQKLNTKICHA